MMSRDRTSHDYRPIIHCIAKTGGRILWLLFPGMSSLNPSVWPRPPTTSIYSTGCRAFMATAQLITTYGHGAFLEVQPRNMNQLSCVLQRKCVSTSTIIRLCDSVILCVCLRLSVSVCLSVCPHD